MKSEAEIRKMAERLEEQIAYETERVDNAMQEVYERVGKRLGNTAGIINYLDDDCDTNNIRKCLEQIRALRTELHILRWVLTDSEGV